VVRDAAAHLAALRAAEADLRAAGFIQAMELEAADEYSVTVTLAAGEPTRA
jgi:hypothetical protein